MAITKDGNGPLWVQASPRNSFAAQFDQSYRFFKTHGCVTLGLPNSIDPASPGGEIKNPKPFAGFAIIQNIDVGSPDKNAQSVNLVAPTVGDNQKRTFKCGVTLSADPNLLIDLMTGIDIFLPETACGPAAPGLKLFAINGYSAFVNNVMTNMGYFLQVGLLFRPDNCSPGRNASNALDTSGGGRGQVVWTGSKTVDGQSQGSLQAQPLPLTYCPGHHYFTTISYTNGTWWTCAADIADWTTYNCVAHNSEPRKAEGTLSEKRHVWD